MPMFVWIAPKTRSAQKLREFEFMVYASVCLWVLVIVLLAWGVQTIWAGMTRPKTLNVALLPGTIAASLGRIIALLITGATFPDAQKGGSGATGSVELGPQPRMRVAGPIIVAAIPMTILAALIYVLIVRLGAPVVSQIPQNQIARDLPLNMPAFWEQLRALVTLCEKTLDAVRNTEVATWQRAAFVYLMICLTVRLAPFPGNLKGHVLAVVLLCIAAVLAGTLTPRLEELISASWPLLCLTVGWLLLLLLASLIAKAFISSARTVIKWD